MPTNLRQLLGDSDLGLLYRSFWSRPMSRPALFLSDRLRDAERTRGAGSPRCVD